MPKSKKILEPGQEPGEKVRKLTDQQELFCLEYLKDRNATQAYVRVYGVDPMVAKTTGPRLMANDRISARINELLAGHKKKLNITAERVLAEIAALAFVNADDVFDFEKGQLKQKIPRAKLRGLTGISYSEGKYGASVNVQMDKLGALEKLAKYVGIYNEGAGDNDQGSGSADLGGVLISVRRVREKRGA